MRVLIYVEPHPIRNSRIIFEEVARRFLPLLAGATPDFDVRMYMTKSLADALGEQTIATVQQRLIRATPDEEMLFAGRLVDWETDGIPAWLDLMTGGEVADDYLNVLRRVWSIFPYDIVIHWGENGAVTRFLEERPVTRIAMELGCTRAPFLASVVADPFGTNGSALVPRLSVKDLRYAVDDNPMSSAEALFGYSSTMEALPYEQQFLPLVTADWSSRILGTKRRVAYLPLQLHDDANLLRFSNYSSVEEVVLDAVPKLASAGFLTMIKTHPDATKRRQSRVAYAIAREALRPWADDVLWLDATESKYENSQLVALADLVVTVNSSVGFEALYFDKVVSVLGDAVYKPKDLFPDLETAVSGDFDLEEYRNGTGLLRRFMLGGYLAPDAIRGSAAAFEQMALTVDAGYRTHRGSPSALAANMYRSFSLTREHQARSRMLRGGSLPGSAEFAVPSVTAQQLESAPNKVDNPLTAPARRLLGVTRPVDLEGFRGALLEALGDPELAVQLIRSAGLVDERFYLETHRDVAKARKDPIDHWARYGVREGRKPRAGLAFDSADDLVDQLTSAAAEMLEGHPLPSFPLEHESEARRQAGLEAVRRGLGRRGNRLAVVAHLYYRDLVPDLLAQLAAIPEGFDLVVTMPDWGNRQIVEMVGVAYPDAVIYAAANRGRDIGPFIDVLPALLEHDYDAVLKVQTKAGFFSDGHLVPEGGRIWRESAFDMLLGSPGQVEETIAAFRAEEKVTMVGPAPFYLPLSREPYSDNGALLHRVLGAGLEADEGGFFAGTMFWVRPDCLRPLVEAGLSLESFEPETGANDGALVHNVERLFGQLALSGGRVDAVDETGRLAGRAEPTEMSIDAYVTHRIKAQAANRAARQKGALAW